MSTSRLVVTGSLAYDFISQYDRPFDEILLPEKLHELSVCFVVNDKQRFFGGTAGNIAYNLALLGESCTILAGVGYDFEPYEKYLKKWGVDLSALRPTPDLPTASATIITDPKGNQIAEFHPGAMGKGLKPLTGAFAQAKAAIIAPDAPLWMMDYVRLAKHFKVPYFFDPGQGLPSFSKEQLLEALEGAEGVFVNDYEFELLKKMTGLSEAKLFAKVRTFVVTFGARGSEIYFEEERFSIPVVPPREALDPTGCGDAYRAGFLVGYLKGRTAEVCGRMGALAASYTVEHHGTQNHSFKSSIFAKRYKDTFASAW